MVLETLNTLPEMAYKICKQKDREDVWRCLGYGTSSIFSMFMYSAKVKRRPEIHDAINRINSEVNNYLGD